MNYCVCFLFTPDFEEVLLIKKNKTDFAGRLNGVGGKQNPHEYPHECALREIKEETGCILQPRRTAADGPDHTLMHLAQVKLHTDCAHSGDDCAVLDFWMSVVEKDEPSQQPGETEHLVWMPVSKVLSTPTKNDLFAGDGDVQYMINLALRMFGTSKEA